MIETINEPGTFYLTSPITMPTAYISSDCNTTIPCSNVYSYY